MGTLARSRFAFTASSTAVLAACSALQSPSAAPGGSWMLPEAKSADLLYVATADNVYAVTYRGGKLAGALGISANEVCSDAAGDVFVTHVNGSQQIYEYAHGGSAPIQTLNDGDIPLGCAVDPTTGDLAVTNEASGAGDVAIYARAQEPAEYYSDSAIGTFGLCAYDDSGNLFVDGTGNGNVLAELPKGSSTFANYRLNERVDSYDSIQWDGEYVTLSNPTTRTVLRLRLTRRAHIIGRTHVRRWYSRYYGHWPYTQTVLQGNEFLAQSSTDATIGLWRYPNGGAPTKVIGPFEKGSVQIWAIAFSPGTEK